MGWLLLFLCACFDAPDPSGHPKDSASPWMVPPTVSGLENTDSSDAPAMGETSLLSDGVQLTLEDLGPGDLLITEIMIDPTQVADYRGEWFELVNTTEFSMNTIDQSEGSPNGIFDPCT